MKKALKIIGLIVSFAIYIISGALVDKNTPEVMIGSEGLNNISSYMTLFVVSRYITAVLIVFTIMLSIFELDLFRPHPKEFPAFIVRIAGASVFVLAFAVCLFFDKSMRFDHQSAVNRHHGTAYMNAIAMLSESKKDISSGETVTVTYTGIYAAPYYFSYTTHGTRRTRSHKITVREYVLRDCNDRVIAQIGPKDYEVMKDMFREGASHEIVLAKKSGVILSIDGKTSGWDDFTHMIDLKYVNGEFVWNDVDRQTAKDLLFIIEKDNKVITEMLVRSGVTSQPFPVTDGENVRAYFVIIQNGTRRCVSDIVKAKN